MFEVLTYTDCAADESVNGRSGFQFQAESADATAVDEQRISSGLLHVVPAQLDAEQPHLHPPTCAYRAFEGRYYLARGRSTGRTLSGRPGNQFTRTIVTSAADDILPLRPAQLFSAAEWTAEPPSGTRIPSWHAPLEVDPDFEAASLHEMVTADPWARELLPRFLTMVEQATAEPRVKLVIAHPDQRLVMRWIALASLFEDGEQALQLSFRVFSPNPVGDAAQVVGAHPLLSPGLTPTPGAGFNLVDLDGRVATPVEVSPSAAEHAAWFLGQDPYEALDAVETSRRWAEFLEPGPAALAASVACLDGEGRAASGPAFDAVLTALGGLAEARQHDELEAYGEALVDAVVARRPQDGDDISTLTTPLWRLHSVGEDDLAAGLALAGLEWAAHAPGAAAAWSAVHSTADTGVLRWSDAGAAAHAGSLVARVLATCSDDDLPDWFSAGRSLGTNPSMDEIGPAVGRLARRWAARPELTGTARSWLHVERVTVALEKELDARFRAGDSAALTALAAGSWDWLIGEGLVVDPAGRPRSVWLAARTRGAVSPEDWLATLRTVAPLLPDHAGDLFLGSDASTAEVVAWLSRPKALSPRLAQRVEQLVDACVRDRLPDRLRQLAGALRTEGVNGVPLKVVEVLADHDRVKAVVDQAWHLAGRRENPALQELASFPAPWATLYADAAAELVLCAADEDGAAALAGTVRGRLDAVLARAVVRLAVEGDGRAVTGTLRLLAVDPKGLGASARDALAGLWEDPQQAPVRHRLAQAASAQALQDLESALAPNRRTTFTGFGRRGAKGRA